MSYTCRCKICIIPKDIHIYLNIFKTNIVLYLPKNKWRHTCNSAYSTKSAAHNKEKLFPDGEFLHAYIKDSSQCISCTLIKPNNFIHMKFALGFFDECTKNITSY